ncbi:KaiC/GvpD/RAD55 family RecA-like ATPase [Methanohalophilus levihalophilus]|uniref:RAD55 family ATPase n=1 Tax=Methanohalophilus levihalophilus TaxID=1431282 RepID=UPI001AE1F4C0|nr:RAD55 family ATPase [Methanohalophilus levihalophilus]MBP2030843.1 KaiC/GvpD/RAD55 family RecA-like ATPase [Methanohalophilus levihalophilus]
MEGYLLGIKELDDLIGGIKEGTNLMLLGPPMSGKDSIVNNILYTGLDDSNASVLVSTREPGENVLEWFLKHDPDMDTSSLGIVDCVTKTLGIAAEDTDNIKRVSSPVDLTGIGVRISQYFEELWMKKENPPIRLCINSLSTVLMYSNLQTVFRFLHVFTGRIKAAKGLGLFVVEDQMHDPQTIATLKQLFDGMIEIKEHESGHMIRVVGLSPRPTPWFDYVIEDSGITFSKAGD